MSRARGGRRLHYASRLGGYPLSESVKVGPSDSGRSGSVQPEGEASDSERAEEDCGASLPALKALKALPSPDSRERSQVGCSTNVTHSAMLCGQAAMPLWSSNTRVDGLGRAPLAKVESYQGSLARV